MQRIISFFSFLILMSLPLFAISAEKAEEQYKNNQFTEAAESYEAILAEGVHSADLYYNLGNCYYKSNQVARAILNYERALLLDPNDSDIRFNLEVARLKTIDKIESVGTMWFVRVNEYIQNLSSADGWGRIAIASFLLLLAGIALYFLGRTVVLKKVGFFTGLLFLIVSIAAHFYGKAQFHKMSTHEYSVIMLPTVTVKSTPDTSGTDLFVLHEGTKVKVKSTLGSWIEIQLSDGNVGWVTSSAAERI